MVDDDEEARPGVMCCLPSIRVRVPASAAARLIQRAMPDTARCCACEPKRIATRWTTS